MARAAPACSDVHEPSTSSAAAAGRGGPIPARCAASAATRPLAVQEAGSRGSAERGGGFPCGAGGDGNEDQGWRVRSGHRVSLFVRMP